MVRLATLLLMLGTALTRPALADVLLTAANEPGLPGSTVTLAVHVASTGGSLPTVINFDLVFDATRLSVSPAAIICDASCQAGQKLAQASLVEPGRLRVLVFGLNTTAIPDGNLVGVPFAVAATAATGLAPVDGQKQVVSDASAAALPSAFVDGAICIGDSPAACATCGNGSIDSGEQCGETGLPSCASDLLCVECRCRQRGDCALNGGGVDLFDVLAQIDVVLGRMSPDVAQQVVCDDDCNEKIDLFDILIGIDVVLGRQTLPLVCPTP
jgi:cohesin domain-containing protein